MGTERAMKNERNIRMEEDGGMDGQREGVRLRQKG
jgi:hypothetical protein